MARRPDTPEQRAAQALVGERVREARKAAGLTQEALAQAANLHPTFVSRLEGGRVNPSLGTLVSVAKAAKTTVEALTVGL